jgi:hypothetical protein
MKISFKNFESKVNTYAGKGICAEIDVNILTDFSGYDKVTQTGAVTKYLFDFDKLFKNGEEMFNKCIAIGIKDSYTETEQEFISNFFGFTAAISIMDPHMETLLKAQKSMINLVDRDGPMLSLLYEDYGVGFEDVVKYCNFADDRTMNHRKFTLICEPILQDEIKAFIAFLSKYTYNTLRMNVLKSVSSFEDEAV